MVEFFLFNKDVKFVSNVILDSAGTTLNGRLNSKASYSLNEGLKLNQIKCDVLVPETQPFVRIGANTTIVGVLNVTSDLNVDGTNVLNQIDLKANI